MSKRPSVPGQVSTLRSMVRSGEGRAASRLSAEQTRRILGVLAAIAGRLHRFWDRLSEADRKWLLELISRYRRDPRAVARMSPQDRERLLRVLRQGLER